MSGYPYHLLVACPRVVHVLHESSAVSEQHSVADRSRDEDQTGDHHLWDGLRRGLPEADADHDGDRAKEGPHVLFLPTGVLQDKVRKSQRCVSI